jgi:hypothetical protein
MQVQVLLFTTARLAVDRQLSLQLMEEKMLLREINDFWTVDSAQEYSYVTTRV